MPDDELDRRDFLKVTAAGVLAANLLSSCGSEEKKAPLQPTDEQRALRSKSPQSHVGICLCPSYKDDIEAALAPLLSQLDFNPNGKKVFLKMNLLDVRGDLPLTTAAEVVRAVAAIAWKNGASQITVGDGSAVNRDTDYLRETSGIGKVCRDLGLKFIDLNIDDVSDIANAMKFTREPSFLLAKSVMDSDFIISMPKMKTHRWAKVTCALKNLFGVVPGRAYGWPKNFLHVNGIDASVLDLAYAIKPHFAIVDAIVSMEGNGPLNGTAKQTGFMVAGSDLTAVDAVCCRTMEIDPYTVPYLKVAGQVLGNLEESSIKIHGEPVDKVKQKFVLPKTFTGDGSKTKNQGADADLNAT